MRTGNYVNQLKGDLQYKAFIPNRLPFNIKQDYLLQDLLSKADLALGRLDGIADVLPDVNFFIFMYIKKEAALSSQIEGTKATFSDVLKAEAKLEDFEIHKDVEEILNYIKAMDYGLERLETLPLSLRLIKEIHAILLKGVRGEGKYPGEFRTSQNWIGGVTLQNASFVPPPAHEVLALMGNLESFIHDVAPLPVLIKIGLIHYQFETIHPFLDGNGRIGRLLITFYLCQQKILHKPLLCISEFFKRFRQDYYDKLDTAREKDDLEGWLIFFLSGVIDTAERAVETARKIHKLRQRDIEKVVSMGRSEKAMVLLNALYKKPLVRIKDIEQITGLANPNAIVLTKKLLKLDILKELTGQRRNRVYAYQGYVKLFE